MKHSAFAIALASLLVTSGASAAVANYSATLSGGQVVPPVASPGSGTATLQFDTATKMLTGTITFSGISVTDQSIGGAGPCGASPATRVEILPAPVGNTITLTPVTLSTLNEGFLIGGALSITLKAAGGNIRGQIYEVGSGKTCGGSPTPDAGTPVDASVPDSSAPDSSAPADAGPVDAASPPSPAPSASTAPPAPAADSGGCNSSGGSAGLSWLFASALGAALIASRRAGARKRR